MVVNLFGTPSNGANKSRGCGTTTQGETVLIIPPAIRRGCPRADRRGRWRRRGRHIRRWFSGWRRGGGLRRLRWLRRFRWLWRFRMILHKVRRIVLILGIKANSRCTPLRQGPLHRIRTRESKAESQGNHYFHPAILHRPRPSAQAASEAFPIFFPGHGMISSCAFPPVRRGLNPQSRSPPMNAFRLSPSRAAVGIRVSRRAFPPPITT